jgi:N-acetyl-gamma-glutamyl-phosphate reductase
MVMHSDVCSCVVAATKIGIIGASGFTGAELLRLCASHPDLEVVVATGDTQAGTPVAALYPSLAAAYPDLVFAPYDPVAVTDLDLVFCALPHGSTQVVVAEILGKVPRIVDLSADFRLKDPALYPQWYGEEHRHPELLAEAVYGLPEFFRTEIRDARLVAAPGCFVTAAALALRPLVQGGIIEASGVIVDAASGVSGAGRSLKPETAFCTVDEDITAYGLLTHRHTPEIEQATGAQVLFTPHLAPMNRGILATCYARPAQPTSTDEVLAALHAAYDDEPFIVVSERSPSTKATLGSNSAHLTARVDPRTKWVVVISAIDNLVKGASGQALQCANILLGRPEVTGLPVVGVYP